MIRKILNNNFFAFFLVVPFTVWFLSSLFSPVSVSAASSAVFTYDSTLSASYASSTEFPFTVFDGSGKPLLCIQYNEYLVFCSDRYVPDYTDITCRVYVSNPWVGVVLTNTNTNANYNYGMYQYRLNGTTWLPYYSSSNTSGDVLYVGSDTPVVYLNTDFFVNPVYDPVSNNILALGIDEDGFYNWLVSTTKDSNFTPYLPLSRLFQYLQFYDAWGSSPQKFLMRYNIDYGDIIGSHLNNIQVIELKNLTDRLYREYLNSLKYPPADFPARDSVNIRKDIDTNTTDNNTVLITDDSNDSVIVSILRDILRGVIALRNQIFVTGTDIITGLNNLDFTVNVANDGGSGFNASDIWGSGDITESENYLALTAAFMDKGVDVSAAENMQINYLENATQRDSFTVTVVMPDEFVNGQFTEKTVTYTIDNTSKMYNTLILFRKLIAFAVVAYFAIRIRFELPHLIRGE